MCPWRLKDHGWKEGKSCTLGCVHSLLPCDWRAAILGVVNNAWLTKVTSAIFGWSLETFGWLYQWVALGTLLLITILAFSPLGKIRFGGPHAKAKFSFGAWFAMTLTGGIATGLITYGVNEPIIYLGNIYGELEGSGIEPYSQEAVFFPWPAASITGPSFPMPCMP